MIKRYGGLFLKGMAMGAADVVPGVSGGTIAFITGIYEELIGSLSGADFKALQLLLKGEFKDFWTHINGPFLSVLFAGIFTSVLSLASLLSHWLEAAPTLVWSFFFGLVAASVWIMGKTVKTWNAGAVTAFIIGTIVAYLITELPATQGVDSPLYLILCGALAICAMILPGISGSFILLLLGAYSVVLTAVADRDLLIIVYVGIGAVIGLLSFSKGLKYIFANYYNLTISLLTGFLLGSLNKLWPWKEVLTSFVKHKGTEKEEVVALTVQNLAPGANWPIALLCAIGGIGIVVALELAGKKNPNA